MCCCLWRWCFSSLEENEILPFPFLPFVFIGLDSSFGAPCSPPPQIFEPLLRKRGWTNECRPKWKWRASSNIISLSPLSLKGPLQQWKGWVPQRLLSHMVWRMSSWSKKKIRGRELFFYRVASLLRKNKGKLSEQHLGGHLPIEKKFLQVNSNVVKEGVNSWPKRNSNHWLST